MMAAREAAPAVLALLFNALMWGLSWLPFKALHGHGVHPLWGTVLVYLAMLALFVAWRPRVLAEAARHPALLWLALAAGLTNVCFNWAVTVGDVVRVVLLFYLMPAWAVLLAWALAGERPTAGALLRLALALAGVTLVLKKPGMAWPWPESGADALALAGGFFFALTSVLLRRWRATPAAARALAMFGGGALVAGAVALAGLAGGWVPAFAPLAAPAGWLPWAIGLALAFLSGNLALQYGAARLPAQVTSLIMLSEVVFASFSAVLLGAATLAPATLAGGALILAAALLAVATRRSG